MIIDNPTPQQLMKCLNGYALANESLRIQKHFMKHGNYFDLLTILDKVVAEGKILTTKGAVDSARIVLSAIGKESV